MPKSMKQLNCDYLQMTIGFDEKEFKRKEFLLETKLKPKDLKGITTTIGSKNNKKKEHAHLFLSLNGEKSLLRLEFIPDVFGAKEIEEPYLEDITKWLAGFFKDKVVADIMVVFKYNRQYESEIQLHYPLLLKSPLFEGVKITGHELAFPPDSYLHRGTISSNGKELIVLLFAKFKLDLSDFEYHQVIEAFSKYSNSLVKKKEGENEENKRKI
jgi:hypothetical protein